MNNLQWEDLHNDKFDSEEGKDTVDVEIEVNENVYYECTVNLHTFRNIPYEAECVSMTRYLVVNGSVQDGFTTDLDICDFPEYIKKAAEKKAML